MFQFHILFSNQKYQFVDAQSFPKREKNICPAPCAEQHCKDAKKHPSSSKNDTPENLKIIENLICVPHGAQPGLQAPPWTRPEAPQTPPALFFGAQKMQQKRVVRKKSRGGKK